ncbi:MAG TPA: menaquinone biosynthetic enzyme MqnA/MqnD family protein [Candidatus Hypogeohydataceae bacterium YC41]
MEKSLKVGVVPYLNAKPLIAGMEEAGAKLNFVVPSKLPNLLEQGGVDVALIPSIEYLRGRPFFVIPGISIASRGAVRSVLLFLKTPAIKDIKRVALDEASLTSATLVGIILQERYGLPPSKIEYIPWPGGQNLNGIHADAVLVIGDNAMKMSVGGRGTLQRAPTQDVCMTLDLGAEWKALTGLPFVYALWVTSRKEFLGSATRLLSEAKRRGLATLDEIARREAKRLGLWQEICLRYLSENIHYELGEEEMAGLRRFYRYALSMGLASEGVNLDFGSKKNIREAAFQKTDRI